MHFKSLDELRKTKVGGSTANAHLYAVAAPEDHQRERDPLSALVKKSNGCTSRKTCVDFVITIVSFRHKELDDDNLCTGCKPLRDSIATSLGIDDRDRRFKWEYKQVITEGAEGTQVLISAIPKPMRHGKVISQGIENPT